MIQRVEEKEKLESSEETRTSRRLMCLRIIKTEQQLFKIIEGDEVK